MHPLVRDLYKRFLIVGHEWPAGIEVVRRRAKEGFLKNAHLEDEVEIRRAVSRGRWYLRNEMIGAIQLRKYRKIKQRYEAEEL
eukprot:UC4_evm1s10